MQNVIEWNVGLHGYKKCTLEINEGEGPHKFTTELLDVPHDSNRSITEIFNDHLSIRRTKYVEILYSGGMDSELVLLSCLKNNIPVIAVTLVIKVKSMIVNTHDLYYAEKFCRENSIPHTLVELNADKFFENGDHYTYANPYHIVEPHVATHFWLLERCSYFPVVGGDWPWVHTNRKTTEHVLSPNRLEYHSYERFMKDKGIHGIGNMIGHSLDSTCKLIQVHLDNHINVGREAVSVFKSRMFQTMYPEITPRLRSYGWELSNLNSFFDKEKYKRDMIDKVKSTTPYIKWNNTIKTLINTSLNENDKF
jgi:hypothetical protein